MTLREYVEHLNKIIEERPHLLDCPVYIQEDSGGGWSQDSEVVNPPLAGNHNILRELEFIPYDDVYGNSDWAERGLEEEDINGVWIGGAE